MRVALLEKFTNRKIVKLDEQLKPDLLYTMITKYFSKVVIKFNPMAKEAKPARLFLSAIPPALRGSCSIDSEVLTANSKNAPIVKVTYKDKKTLEADPTKLGFGELSEFFDRHSRKLQIKESIES